MKVILASTSKYRAELLARLGISFETAKPDLDEDYIKNILLSEKASPLEIAETLSRQKGESVHKQITAATIISGDQLVQFKGHIIGKPHTFEKAAEQLTQMQGQEHELITATTVIINSKAFHHNNIAKMKMKTLSLTEIERYLKLDHPLDCAGSIKIEAHGISLFERIQCDDFSAIQGLPLIWISNLLKRNGYELFKK